MSSRRTSTRRSLLAAATGLTLLVGPAVAGCSQGPAPGDPSATTAELEVVSWWTSPSEKAALTVLYDAFRAANPGVTIIDGAVAGGSGSNAQVVLATGCVRATPRTCGRPSSAAR